MQKSRSRWMPWAFGILAAFVAIPMAVACVKARNLAQQVEMAGDEIVIGRVALVDEILIEEPDGELFPWTILHVDVEQSLVAGSTGRIEVITRGSVRPGSPSTTVTPSPEDLKAGRKLLLFLGRRAFEAPELGASCPWQIYSYAEVYRIEEADTRTGPRQVLLGQGSGSAFPLNLDLDRVRAEVKLVVAAKGGEKR